MQKSFHVNKKYSYLIPFLDEQPNVSKYLCELVAKDYSNQMKCLEMTELADLVSDKLELRVASRVEKKMDQLFVKLLQNLALEVVKQPATPERFVASFFNSPSVETKRSSLVEKRFE